MTLAEINTFIETVVSNRWDLHSAIFPSEFYDVIDLALCKGERELNHVYETGKTQIIYINNYSVIIFIQRSNFPGERIVWLDVDGCIAEVTAV